MPLNSERLKVSRGRFEATDPGTFSTALDRDMTPIEATIVEVRSSVKRNFQRISGAPQE
jgi:hypothetical protein